MTNRQALMNWLGTLSNEEFIEQMLSRRGDIPERVDHAMCVTCKAKYGECCILNSESDCPITLNDWLDMENTADWSGSVDS